MQAHFSMATLSVLPTFTFEGPDTAFGGNLTCNKTAKSSPQCLHAARHRSSGFRCRARVDVESDTHSEGQGGARWRQLLGQGTISLAAAAALLAGSADFSLARAEGEFEVYYGTAASASSYGGYGGNASKKDVAEYIYDYPASWKERAVSKVEKGTNGTDSEFYNPKKRTEKIYTTYLAGFRKLPPRENVLNNLALSDVNLQDQIGSADNVDQTTRQDEGGQTYYDYEIDSPVGHSLISVTCAKNKLYAHFVNAPVADWNRDKAMLRHIHESFKTVGTSYGDGSSQ